MKKLMALAILVVSLGYQHASAQIKLGVNLNIGTQPDWGPTGYDHVDYYYLPDIDAYYNVSARQYTYMEGSRWVTRASLPSQYRNYNLYNGYKVVVNEKNPWNRAAYYRTNYARYKNWKGKRQEMIRDSHDDKYRRGRDDRRDPRDHH